jgi:hypothetical protein
MGKNDGEEHQRALHTRVIPCRSIDHITEICKRSQRALSVKRASVIVPVILSISVLACESKNSLEQSGDTLIKTYKNTQQFGDRTSLQNLQESIRAFSLANNRFPRDLGELEGFTGVTLDSSKYEYDPLTGKITQRE